MTVKRFGLIGAAGYIAPRHLKAIKETGNDLVVSMDINDSVGILDRYFPNSEFFTEFEEFQCFVEAEKFKGRAIDYITICSPNYLHASHIKFALSAGCNVICEKPIVMNTTELDSIIKYEKRFNKRVYSILQLRLHPSIQRLRQLVDTSPKDKFFDVELTYLTSRGRWYDKSWKGFMHKSGGVASNIGVHFFDMLSYVFGDIDETILYYRDSKTVVGTCLCKTAKIRWFLSINSKFLPKDAVKGEKLTYRSIKVQGEELEFSDGFTELHDASYRDIMMGKGFGIEENRAAIETVQNIREIDLSEKLEEPHPLIKKLL